jgi:outer membrane immunogenic protein
MVRRFASSFFLAAVFGASAVQIASAADLGIKAPPVAAPAPPSWTGFYFGLNGGVTWFSDMSGTFQDPNGVIATTHVGLSHSSSIGAEGGFQVGYNWQFSPVWVAGIEGDIDWLGGSAKSTVSPLGFGAPGFPLIANTSVAMSIDPRWIASARGRLGYVGLWNNTLFYATGGVAWADISYSGVETNFPPTFATTFASQNQFDKTQTGWVAGGGVEYQATNNWLLRIEYLYYQFNHTQTGTAALVPNPGAFPLPFVYNWSTGNIQTVRVALSYKFW